MKIAIASTRIVDQDINYNLSQMERYVKEAKATSDAVVVRKNTPQEIASPAIA